MFLGNCPPTPPLSQHFAQSESFLNILKVFDFSPQNLLITVTKQEGFPLVLSQLMNFQVKTKDKRNQRRKS